MLIKCFINSIVLSKIYSDLRYLGNWQMDDNVYGVCLGSDGSVHSRWFRLSSPAAQPEAKGTGDECSQTLSL